MHTPTALLLAAVAATAWHIPHARADSTFEGQVSVLGGIVHRAFDSKRDEVDPWAGIVPAVRLNAQTKTCTATTTYAAGGFARARSPSSLDHRFTLASSFETSARTRLQLSADASVAALYPAFAFASVVASPRITAPLGGVPATPTVTEGPQGLSSMPQEITPGVSPEQSDGSRWSAARAAQSLTWDWSPRTTLRQQLDAVYTKSFVSNLSIDAAALTHALSLSYASKRDIFAGEARASLLHATSTNTPSRLASTVTLAPQWQRAISPSTTSLVSAGATWLARLDANAPHVIVPTVRGAIVHSAPKKMQDTSSSITYLGGIQTTLLSGQILYAHQVAIDHITSVAHPALRLRTSLSFLHGLAIDQWRRARDSDGATPLGDASVDAFNVLAELAWLPVPRIAVLVRASAQMQVYDTNIRGIAREGIILGVSFFGAETPSQPFDPVLIR